MAPEPQGQAVAAQAAARSPTAGACPVQEAGGNMAEAGSACATYARSRVGTFLLAEGSVASGGARACVSAECSVRGARKAAAPWRLASRASRAAGDAQLAEVRAGAWEAPPRAVAPWVEIPLLRLLR